MKQMLDLYSDYLLASFSQTSATGLSNLMNGDISHDQVTRFLSQEKKTSRDLWRVVKPFVKKIQSAEGVLIIDDSIEEKPYTDENDIVCWHYDHSKNRSIKGINFLSTLYHNQAVSLPIGFQLVAKTEEYLDKKTTKIKRRSPVTKNEMARQMILQAVKNQILFRFVLFDLWFASSENLMFIKHNCEKDVICPIKHNRKIALSLEDKINGQYKTVSTLEIQANAELEIYLEGVDFPLTLVKQVFTNEDGSIGILYLISSDRTLKYDHITTIYQKRWNASLLP